jgi:hypothetical protein
MACSTAQPAMYGRAMGLREAADDSRTNSISHRLRERRFAAFERAVNSLSRPVRILDIGGEVAYWENRGWTEREDIHITLLNLEVEPATPANITSVKGNATRLPWADDTFDIAFSNSVIEHLYTLDRQRQMASEVQRVARAYWVQTPNFWFPIEPHYLVPIWHWLPERARVAILTRRRVGWAGRTPDPAKALEIIRETRLMRRRELAQLFPDATLMPERIGGLVKSWTATSGF